MILSCNDKTINLWKIKNEVRKDLFKYKDKRKINPKNFRLPQIEIRDQKYVTEFT